MFKKLLLAILACLFMVTTAFAAVDINTASVDQLKALNGIGPAKAKAIVDYRAKNGPFKTAEDITKVPGIKEGTFKKIKADITVGGKAPAPTAKPAAPAPAPAKPAPQAGKSSAPVKK